MWCHDGLHSRYEEVADRHGDGKYNESQIWVALAVVADMECGRLFEHACSAC